MENEGIPYWRRIWQITSGCIKNCCLTEVHDVLMKHKHDIIHGVVVFTSNNSNESKNEIEKQWTNEFSQFITRLANYLIIPRHQAWLILQSYIVNDFCGSLKTIQNLKYEMQIVPLLINIWKYFSSERIYMLKTLKTVIEYMKDPEHPYAKIFTQFTEHVGIRNIWNNIVDEFTYLIREVNRNVHDNDKSLLLMWVERNVRETIEVVQCLILLTNYIDISLDDFHEILVKCKMHGFGREPVFFKTVTILDQKSLTKLKLCDVALLLCMANQLWSQDDTSWYKSSNITNADIAPLMYREEHGAVCFIWISLHMVLENKVELFSRHFQELMARAIHLNCFQFFAELVSHEMFQDAKSLAGVTVQEALFNLLIITANNFDDNGQMLSFPGIISSLEVLLKNQHFAKQFFEKFKDGNGDHISVWSTAIELFPYDFYSLTTLAQSILSANTISSKQVLHDLMHLPWYTESYKPNSMEHSVRRQNSESVILLQPYVAKDANYIQLPMNTEIIIRDWMNTTLAHYRHHYSFWTVLLAEMNRFDIAPSNFEAHLSKIKMGLSVVLALLKSDHDVIRLNPFLKEIIVALFNLLELTCSMERPSFSLISICLDISTEMLYQYRPFVLSQIESLFVLPRLAENEFNSQEIIRINVIEPGKIGHLIIQTERHTEQFCSVLVSYLNFLRTSIMLNKNNLKNVDIPGLMFVLKEIFPHFMIRLNKHENMYQDILYQCIHLIFEIFQCLPNEEESSDYIFIRRIAYYSFLYECSGRSLLRILSIGNSGIQTIMENETNWSSGRGVRYINVIKKVLAILMQLLTLRKNVINNKGFTPLENFIYRENDGVQIMQAVTSFLNHPFDDAIPNLACRLLKKFTTELQMSMLAALNMEPDQIRVMFTQRLRDRYECDELKLAIIELICVSVPKQPGMTEAFFKTAENDFDHNSTMSITFNEGIGSFLVEYLIAFSSDISLLNTVLLSRIMELLHVLWMYQREVLIADLTKDEQFWPSLCCPLFRDICFSDKTYSEIINIIAKEIHKKSGNIDTPLMDVLKELFSNDKFDLDRWLHYIFNTADIEQEMIIDDLENVQEPSTHLIVSWKDFLIIAIKFLPESFFSIAARTKLIQETCKALKKFIFNPINSSIVTFISELYLFLIVNWGDICLKHDTEFNADLPKIIEKVSTCYMDLPERLRKSMLSITILSINYIKFSSPQYNITLINSLIDSISVIFDFEYNSYMYFYQNKKNDSDFDTKDHKPFLMCFQALNELMLTTNNYVAQEVTSWFHHSQYLCKLIVCVKCFSEKKSTLPLTKVALENIINYANSSYVNDFLSSDIAIQLWETLQPTIHYKRAMTFCFDIPERLPQDMIEWFIIYKRIIIVLTILLKKLGHLFLREILIFVTLHEDIIQNILVLDKCTIDITTLDLVYVVLLFLHELFKYEKYWKLDHEQSFNALLEAIKNCLNGVSTIVIRPNVMRYYTLNANGEFEENIENESMPVDLQIQIMNILTDIVTLSIRCISQFSPPIYLTLENDIDYSNWNLQINTNFGIPTFGVNDTTDNVTTFGTLICVASLYVRILQQINTNRKSSQMPSPREILVARKNRFHHQTSVSKSDEQKTRERKLTESDTFECFLRKPESNIEGVIKLDYLNPVYNVSIVENFSYTTSVKIYPWFSRLNEEKIYDALETVITFLGSQMSLVLYHDDMEDRQRRLIRRELSSELQTFHEFIKKRITDIYHVTTVADLNSSLLIRKKSGLIDVTTAITEPETNIDKQQTTNVNKPGKRSLDLFDFETNRKFIKQTSIDGYNDELLIMHRNESNAAHLKFISDDYLQFLSIWFTCVLHKSMIKL